MYSNNTSGAPYWVPPGRPEPHRPAFRNGITHRDPTYRTPEELAELKRDDEDFMKAWASPATGEAAVEAFITNRPDPTYRRYPIYFVAKEFDPVNMDKEKAMASAILECFRLYSSHNGDVALDKCSELQICLAAQAVAKGAERGSDPFGKDRKIGFIPYLMDNLRKRATGKASFDAIRALEYWADKS